MVSYLGPCQTIPSATPALLIDCYISNTCEISSFGLRSSQAHVAQLNMQTKNGMLFILMAKSCCGDLADMFEGVTRVTRSRPSCQPGVSHDMCHRYIHHTQKQQANRTPVLDIGLYALLKKFAVDFFCFKAHFMTV